MIIKVCKRKGANLCLCMFQKPESHFFQFTNTWERNSGPGVLGKNQMPEGHLVPAMVRVYFLVWRVLAKLLKDVIVKSELNQHILLMFWKRHAFQVAYFQPNTETIFQNLPRKAYWSQQEFCWVRTAGFVSKSHQNSVFIPKAVAKKK